MWWGSVQPWTDRAVVPEWYARWASPSVDGGARRTARRAVRNALLVRTRCDLFKRRAPAKEV